MRKGRLLENFAQGHTAGVEPSLFPTSRLCLSHFQTLTFSLSQNENKIISRSLFSGHCYLEKSQWHSPFPHLGVTAAWGSWGGWLLSATRGKSQGFKSRVPGHKGVHPASMKCALHHPVLLLFLPFTTSGLRATRHDASAAHSPTTSCPI